MFFLLFSHILFYPEVKSQEKIKQNLMKQRENMHQKKACEEMDTDTGFGQDVYLKILKHKHHLPRLNYCPVTQFEHFCDVRQISLTTFPPFWRALICRFRSGFKVNRLCIFTIHCLALQFFLLLYSIFSQFPICILSDVNICSTSCNLQTFQDRGPICQLSRPAKSHLSFPKVLKTVRTPVTRS